MTESVGGYPGPNIDSRFLNPTAIAEWNSLVAFRGPAAIRELTATAHAFTRLAGVNVLGLKVQDRHSDNFVAAIHVSTNSLIFSTYVDETGRFMGGVDDIDRIHVLPMVVVERLLADN
jgi:hypothetical protein